MSVGLERQQNSPGIKGNDKTLLGGLGALMMKKNNTFISPRDDSGMAFDEDAQRLL